VSLVGVTFSNDTTSEDVDVFSASVTSGAGKSCVITAGVVAGIMMVTIESVIGVSLVVTSAALMFWHLHTVSDDEACCVVSLAAEDGVSVFVIELDGIVCWTFCGLSGTNLAVNQTHCLLSFTHCFKNERVYFRESCTTYLGFDENFI